MYCVQIWDDEYEMVCRFYWVTGAQRAYRLARRYCKTLGIESVTIPIIGTVGTGDRYTVSIEGEGSSYNLDNAIGY